MYSLTHLFFLEYWFSEPPFLGALALWSMVTVFGLMIIAAIVLRLLAKSEKFDRLIRRGFTKFSSLLGWLGVLAFILLFFRYEFVPILSRRFMYGLWLIGFLTWLGFVLHYLFFKMPKLRQEKKEKERLNKYLP